MDDELKALLLALTHKIDAIDQRIDKLEAGSQQLTPRDVAMGQAFGLDMMPVEAGADSHHSYRMERPLRELPVLDVWPSTLEVLVDEEAPRVCMYAQLGGAPPCKREAWFIIPHNAHVQVDLYGCRQHAPLMAITGSRPRRLVRPPSPSTA